MALLKLESICKSFIWGGNKLKLNYGKISKNNTISESWELSCFEKDNNIIMNGKYKNKSLKKFFDENDWNCLGKNCIENKEFPILIKLIDTLSPLSIQVHPDDSYANENNEKFGKTEVWHILDCEEGAYIYYGVKKGVTKEELKIGIEKKILTNYLNKVFVKKGETFFIPAGMVHALGAGITVVEVQQNSNSTYRLYDYDRIDKGGKKRELHVEKALEAIKLEPVKKEIKKYENNNICVSKYFCLKKIKVKKLFSDYVDELSFKSIIVLEGEAKIKDNEESIKIKKGDSIFISANSGKYEIIGDCEVLITYLPKKEKYRIGVDIGGTNIKIGIIDKDDEIISKNSFSTEKSRGYSIILKEIVKNIKKNLKFQKILISEVELLGLGIPGTINSKSGKIIYSNNLKWKDINIVNDLKKYFDCPIFINNDANCAALGENIAGVGKKYKNLIMLTLGTGVGSGIILNNKIFEGGLGGAEIGHITLNTDGILCSCGRKGCFEAYCSATALINITKKFLKKNKKSLILELCNNDIKELNGEIPFLAAKKGDELGIKIVEMYIKNLSEGIINIINIFRPDVIVLSGGISMQKEFLTEPIKSNIKKFVFGGEESYLPEIKVAELENDAGIIGAANLSDTRIF